MNILIKFLDYISTIGLNDLEKATTVKIWPINKYNNYNIFPAEFNLWLNDDKFAVRYWYYKGAYHKSTINCKRKEYPEIITQSEIRPYLIKQILESN